ncbi:hypothetical protein GCM10027202_29910 [Microvirgula curvata]
MQLPPRYLAYDRRDVPVIAMAIDYADGHVTPPHSHPNAQLIHTVQGVLVVGTAHGQWVVPPTRGLWMPAGTSHWVRMVGDVRMRTVFIRCDAAPDLPDSCRVLGISGLLRELILAAIDVRIPYLSDSRDGRLMRLLLDELREIPTLPLQLTLPCSNCARHWWPAPTMPPHWRSGRRDWRSIRAPLPGVLCARPA